MSAPTHPHRRRPLRSLARAVSWHRRKLAVAAAVAAVLVGMTAMTPDGPPTLSVVRAGRQLAGGVAITRGDLEVDSIVADSAPQGALTSPADLVGQVLAAPVAEGQVLTELALVTPRTPVASGQVIAPLRLADADLAALLRPGDRVDVMAADEQSAEASVIATGVRVVTRPPATDPTEGPATPGALVLVAVDRETAKRLAGAAVSATLTVTWR